MMVTKPLDAFVCPATIHFYIQESDSAGAEASRKGTKDLFVIQSLPIITDTDFTGSDPDKTALIEMPRLNAATQYKAVRGFHDLRWQTLKQQAPAIACSHSLISVQGLLRIKVIEYN